MWLGRVSVPGRAGAGQWAGQAAGDCSEFSRPSAGGRACSRGLQSVAGVTVPHRKDRINNEIFSPRCRWRVHRDTGERLGAFEILQDYVQRPDTRVMPRSIRINELRTGPASGVRNQSPVCTPKLGSGGGCPHKNAQEPRSPLTHGPTGQGSRSRRGASAARRPSEACERYCRGRTCGRHG